MVKRNSVIKVEGGLITTKHNVELKIQKAMLKVKREIEKIFNKSSSTHWCEDKTCKCYNPDIEDQNCYIVKKDNIEKLKTKLTGGFFSSQP